LSRRRGNQSRFASTQSDLAIAVANQRVGDGLVRLFAVTEAMAQNLHSGANCGQLVFIRRHLWHFRPRDQNGWEITVRSLKA
jgi:hypothetical protein